MSNEKDDNNKDKDKYKVDIEQNLLKKTLDENGNICKYNIIKISFKKYFYSSEEIW